MQMGTVGHWASLGYHAQSLCRSQCFRGISWSHFFLCFSIRCVLLFWDLNAKSARASRMAFLPFLFQLWLSPSCQKRRCISGKKTVWLCTVKWGPLGHTDNKISWKNWCAAHTVTLKVEVIAIRDSIDHGHNPTGHCHKSMKAVSMFSFTLFWSW